MNELIKKLTKPDEKLFFSRNDLNDVRLGEITSKVIYKDSDVVIIGCPQDEGVRRNGGRIGSALAPDAIREQFYKLTTFGISSKIFDAGDIKFQNSLEDTHDLLTNVVEQLLYDNKILIILGGGNDISFSDGRAMANVFGCENWQAFNIDAHFDVRADLPRNSGTPYRQLLEEKLLKPENFFECAFQMHSNSPVYFEYLKNLGVRLIDLETCQSSDFKFSDLLEQQATDKTEKKIFFGFDVDSVRASDAPGVSAPSPIGLAAKQFIEFAKIVGQNERTKIVEFTEVNPNFDIDNRTAKLVAIAMHKFCSSIKKANHKD